MAAEGGVACSFFHCNSAYRGNKIGWAIAEAMNNFKFTVVVSITGNEVSQVTAKATSDHEYLVSTVKTTGVDTSTQSHRLGAEAGAQNIQCLPSQHSFQELPSQFCTQVQGIH